MHNLDVKEGGILDLISAQAKKELSVMKLKNHASFGRFWPEHHIHNDELKPSPYHRGQILATISDKRTVAIISGSQSGKTSYGGWWLRDEIMKRNGGDFLAVTATYDLFKLKMLPSMLAVYETILGIGKYWAGDKVIEIADPNTGEFLAKRSTDRMWARIILRSADALGGLESATAKAAWLDECLAPETMIETEIGSVSIGEIVNKKLNIKVWSYDIENEKWELKPIVRWIKLPQNKNFIKFGNLRITPDHKVYTKSGYIEVAKILSELQYKENILVNKEWEDITTYLKSNSGSMDGGLSGDSFVYNIEVEGNHNYVANNILVANCGQDKFDFSAYKAIRRRLTLFRGRILMTTTLYNLGWMDSHIITPATKTGVTTYEYFGNAEIEHTVSDKEDVDLIQFDSIINPVFPEQEYLEAKELLPDYEFQMFFRGRTPKRRFLIYDSFDMDKHTCKPFDIPVEWKRFIGVDFGGSNTAAVYYTEHPDTKILYAYREYHSGNKAIKQHVKDMLDGERNVRDIVGGSQSEGQWRKEFSMSGMNIRTPNIGDVETGISRVYQQHASDNIIYFNNLNGIIDSKNTYRRVRDKSGNITDEIEKKKDYHFCLAGDTLIHCEDGIFSLYTIKVGDKVYTRQGFKEVINYIKSGTKYCYIIYFSSGKRLIATEEHPIFLVNSGFTPVIQLKKGDICLNISNKHDTIESVEEYGFLNVFNLTVKDAHEYFANGILVSNCDAERYIISEIRPGNSRRAKILRLK